MLRMSGSTFVSAGPYPVRMSRIARVKLDSDLEEGAATRRGLMIEGREITSSELSSAPTSSCGEIGNT